jgi:hypothetical protein
MKSELRLAEHSVLAGQHVVEIWHGGQFVGQVCGADGPGVRVVTKHPVSVQVVPGVVNVAEVSIAPKAGGTPAASAN